MNEFRGPQSAIRIPRVAAIGVGSLGRHHARNYAELARDGRVEFVGVCDTNAETSAQIASENGSTHYTDWRDLLARRWK